MNNDNLWLPHMVNIHTVERASITLTYRDGNFFCAATPATSKSKRFSTGPHDTPWEALLNALKTLEEESNGIVDLLLPDNDSGFPERIRSESDYRNRFDTAFTLPLMAGLSMRFLKKSSLAGYIGRKQFYRVGYAARLQRSNNSEVGARVSILSIPLAAERIYDELTRQCEIGEEACAQSSVF